jgi:tRNA1(Val) A37 N6-methylase TrmN6
VLEKARASDETLTEDAILGGRVVVRQPRAGFRVGIDSVMLPAAVPARAGETILDIGIGVGAAALCLVRRVAGCKVVGLELQPELADLARSNADRNDLSESLEVVVGTVSDPPERITQQKFFHVMMNPPYLEPGRGRAPKFASRAKSSVESDAALADWIGFGFRVLRSKGSLTIIHRADRLQDLLVALKENARDAGEIVVFPLWPETRRNPAIRVIVRARKGVATPLRIAHGLVLHASDGAFTQDADAVLRDAQALDI